MGRPDDMKECTIACESAAVCRLCFRRKQPYGRDSRDNGLCHSSECDGYWNEPRPGHLWPGELARMDKEDDTDG